MKITVGGETMTIEKALRLLDRYKSALEGLTPGGSEFVNDPEKCARWVRESHNIMVQALKNIIRRLKAEAGK